MPNPEKKNAKDSHSDGGASCLENKKDDLPIDDQKPPKNQDNLPGSPSDERGELNLSMPTSIKYGTADSATVKAVQDFASELANQGVSPEQLQQLIGLNEVALTAQLQPESPAANSTIELRKMKTQLQPGSIFAETYKVISFLGKGGMSEVYKAENVVTKRMVALKFLLPEFLGDAQRVQRFLREGQLAARMEHPNIMTVYSAGVENSIPYLEMEYLPGISLSDHIKVEGQLDPLEAQDIFLQVCEGLNYAHTVRKIIHRDLKPSNIFLSFNAEGKRRVKIIDLGIAKAFAEDDESSKLTRTGVPIGSPTYMSPEQITCQGLDARTDIFSLGVVMYECLTDRLPFPSPAPLGILELQKSRKVEPLGEIRATKNCAERLEAIIFKCLAYEKEERYASVAALKQDLLASTAFDGILHRALFKLLQLFQQVASVIRSKIVPLLRILLAATLLLVLAFGVLSAQTGILKSHNGPPDQERELLVSAVVDKSQAPKDNESEILYGEFQSMQKNNNERTDLGKQFEDIVEKFKQLGKRDLIAGNYQRAQLAFGNALTVAGSTDSLGISESALVYSYLSECLIGEGKWSQAASTVEKALGLLRIVQQTTGPAACFACIEQAQILDHNGQEERAQADYNDAAKLIRGGALFTFPIPLKALLESRLGQFFAKIRDYAQAKEFLDLADDGWNEVGGQQGAVNQAILLNDFALMETRTNPLEAIKKFTQALEEITKLAGNDTLAQAKILFNRADTEWSAKLRIEAVLDRIHAWYLWHQSK